MIRRSMLAHAALAAAAVFAATPIVFAQTQSTLPARPMTIDQARQLVAPFYDLLNRPATKDNRALALAILAPDWRSLSAESGAAISSIACAAGALNSQRISGCGKRC